MAGSFRGPPCQLKTRWLSSERRTRLDYIYNKFSFSISLK